MSPRMPMSPPRVVVLRFALDGLEIEAVLIGRRGEDVWQAEVVTMPDGASMQLPVTATSGASLALADGRAVPIVDVDVTMWQPMATAPQDCSWVEGLRPDGVVVRMHYAEDGTGEFQPPYRGWFEAVREGGTGQVLMYSGVTPRPVAWRPCSNRQGDGPKVSGDKR